MPAGASNRPERGSADHRETDRVRRFYERTAPEYDRWTDLFDRVLLDGRRAAVCSRAIGRTLEIGVGTGRNLAFYPPDVELTAIDISPAMLEIARRRADGHAVDLRLADAQALPFPDASFDTIVCTLCLCTIPDERRALSEARRVLRPAGLLLLLEHVRSPIAPVRWVERLLDPLFRLSGDHLLRDPIEHLGGAGFRLERCLRSKWGIIEEVVARAV
jgi:ubiquinone/menaquinone biosynthesis C-methylase UbiE